MTYRNNDYDGCGHTILGVMFLLDFVGMSIYFLHMQQINILITTYTLEEVLLLLLRVRYII